MTESIVRAAVVQDEPEIWRLFRASHEENALFAMSERKVQYYLDRVLRPQTIAQDDIGPRGVIGVIGEPRSLEGLIMLVLGSPWYSDDIMLDDCMNFVDPAHRKSNHARTLISYAKNMVDQIRSVHNNFKMIIGVASTYRTEAKVRLYNQMFGTPLGAFFMYPPPEQLQMRQKLQDMIIPSRRKYRPHRHERLAMKG